MSSLAYLKARQLSVEGVGLSILTFHRLNPILQRFLFPLLQRVLKRMEAEERTFDPTRADGYAEHISDVVRCERDSLVDWFACQFLGEHRHGGLTDGAAGALPADIGDCTFGDFEFDRQIVAAAYVLLAVADGCLHQATRVAW